MTLAHLLRVLVWIAAVLVILIPTLVWLSPAWQGVLQYQPGMVARADRAGTSRLLLFAALMPPYLSAAWGLFQLSGFCTRLSRGEHFSRAAAISLRRFGISLVIAASACCRPRASSPAPCAGWPQLGADHPTPARYHADPRRRCSASSSA